jgi:hypothetical protein
LSLLSREKYDEYDRIASSCGGCHVCRDRLSEFCGQLRVGLHILPMVLPARKNSVNPLSSSLQKIQRGLPKDYFIIRPRTGVLHAPVYCLAASQGLARCTLPSAFPLRCAYVLQAATGGLA